MDSEEQYIEDYLRGTLTPAEKLLAEARYKEDAAFREAVEDMRLEMQLARMSHAQHVAEEVRAARARHAVARRRPRIPPAYWAAAAAGLLLLGIGGIWLLREPSEEELFREYFVAAPYLGDALGPGNGASEGYREYAAGNYLAAIPLLAAIPVGTPAGDTAQFFLAVARLARGDAAMAAPGLDDLVTRLPAEDVLAQDSRWYLALALLKQGNKEAAVLNLHMLRDRPGASHRAAALRLLERLE